MNFNVKMCPACDEELDDDHNGRCPDCGGTEIVLKSGFGSGQYLTMNEHGDMVMKYDRDDAWQQQWHEMLARLKVLRQHYAPGNYQGEQQVERDVTSFFETCFHVADYIACDPTNNLKLKDIVDYMIQVDPDLRICEGVANTEKHSVRRNRAMVSAWVDEVGKRNDDSAYAVITWQTNQDNGNEDALDLAKRCYTAWRKYHKANGLKTML